MRSSKGGTDIWCPNCKATTTCQAVPVPSVTGNSDDYFQRGVMRDHKDIQFFQRGRRCLICYHGFLTAEVDFDLIYELVELRASLKEVQEKLAIHRNDASTAAKSFRELNNLLTTLLNTDED